MELLTRYSQFFESLPADTAWAVDPGLRAQRPGPADETALVARAVVKRQREFRSGRNMARKALASLGVQCASLLRDQTGAPVWPAGVCGSISHCDSLSVAVASRSLAGIGIDVEPVQILTDGVRDLVLSDEDQFLDEDPVWPLRVFCAKEAFYKAWASELGFVPDFHDAAVRRVSHWEYRIDPVSAPLRLAVGTAPLHGRWAEINGYLFALLFRPGVGQASKNASSSSICDSPSNTT